LDGAEEETVTLQATLATPACRTRVIHLKKSFMRYVPRETLFRRITLVRQAGVAFSESDIFAFWHRFTHTRITRGFADLRIQLCLDRR